MIDWTKLTTDPNDLEVLSKVQNYLKEIRVVRRKAYSDWLYQKVVDKTVLDIGAIEHNLDREEHDFSIEVTSAGASEPIVMPRQYPKNIGRKLIVKTSTENFEGDLTEANEESITLEWKAREPKPVGKGKITVQKRKEIAISEIEEAKVKLKF